MVEQTWDSFADQFALLVNSVAWAMKHHCAILDGPEDSEWAKKFVSLQKLYAAWNRKIEHMQHSPADGPDKWYLSSLPCNWQYRDVGYDENLEWYSEDSSVRILAHMDKLDAEHLEGEQPKASITVFTHWISDKWEEDIFLLTFKFSTDCKVSVESLHIFDTNPPSTGGGPEGIHRVRELILNEDTLKEALSRFVQDPPEDTATAAEQLVDLLGLRQEIFGEDEWMT